MDATKKAFLRDIGKELLEDNVAIFAGAGMSAGSGFVNWKELLRPIADELGLDVDKEHDLVAIAQYHLNVNSNNRSQLNKRLIEEFAKDADVTINHKILSKLPIRTYWTTNYDKLIENSLVAAGKIPDVKYTQAQLAFTKPRRDAIVYKMHGDIDHPDQAVLTKDDYEKYHVKMDQYLSNLKGDLISKTFIFIGFSFTDPNLDYILSRVRLAYEGSQRRHYCFLKKCQKSESENDADFEYVSKKQRYFIEDLNRFNIKTILIDEYAEITDLLSNIEYEYKKKTIFISGAAYEYGKHSEKDSLLFIHHLSAALIANRNSIVSGFGLGIGSAVISGALEQIYMKPHSSIADQLILRPFPQETSGGVDLPTLWKKYREDMISHAGIAIFLFGNKLVDGKVIPSNGMYEEYEIAKKLGLICIPIGATGYVAKELWEKEMTNLPENTNPELRSLLTEIGDPSITHMKLSEKILEVISFLTQ